jgi:hypothetical protein
MFSKKDYISILINVILATSFIGIFFFTYGAKIEENIAKAQANYIVDAMMDDVKLLPQDKLNDIKSSLQNMTPPDLTKEDNEVEEINKKLLIKALTVIGIIFLVGISTAYYLCQIGEKVNFMEVLKSGLIVLTFIGLTEFSFLTFFASYFISADPNFVKQTFINKIIDKSTSSINNGKNDIINDINKFINNDDVYFSI